MEQHVQNSNVLTEPEGLIRKLLALASCFLVVYSLIWFKKLSGLFIVRFVFRFSVFVHDAFCK